MNPLPSSEAIYLHQKDSSQVSLSEAGSGRIAILVGWQNTHIFLFNTITQSAGQYQFEPAEVFF